MHCRVITKYATLALRCSRNSRSFAFVKAKPTRPWYVRIELLVPMTIMKSNNLSNYWFIFFVNCSKGWQRETISCARWIHWGYFRRGAARLTARPPATLCDLHLQNGARRSAHLIPDVLHFLYAAGQSNRAADDVRLHEERSPTGGRSDACLRDTWIGRTNRGLAAGQT